ncbi:MAG TPA: recombinase family protein [Candidatus Binatia bacterium]|nr:recombinase family protein [Candidatus Binatia bacterium]
MTAHRGKFVAYLRVSTDKQGHSGLGIEAQRKAINDYLNGGPWELLGEFVEVESGRRADRPELIKALAACKRQRARLIIAKLDRLSRNVAFVATLMEGKVDFVCCDFPQANRLTIHILAAVAEYEREMISARTKAALAAAKARGTVLGNPRLAEARAAAARGAALRARTGADRHAAQVLPVIREIKQGGAATLQEIADALNARSIETARGGRWHPTTVCNVLSRSRD